jgi:hypothetical protein
MKHIIEFNVKIRNFKYGGVNIENCKSKTIINLEFVGSIIGIEGRKIINIICDMIIWPRVYDPSG